MEKSTGDRYYYTAYVRSEKSYGKNSVGAHRILRTRSHERGIIRMLHGIIRLSAEGWFVFSDEDLVNIFVILEKEFYPIVVEKDLIKRKALFEDYKKKLLNKPAEDLGVNIK